MRKPVRALQRRRAELGRGTSQQYVNRTEGHTVAAVGPPIRAMLASRTSGATSFEQLSATQYNPSEYKCSPVEPTLQRSACTPRAGAQTNGIRMVEDQRENGGHARMTSGVRVSPLARNAASTARIRRSGMPRRYCTGTAAPRLLFPLHVHQGEQLRQHHRQKHCTSVPRISATRFLRPQAWASCVVAT